ncbi:precorrin-8X methylmutase [Terasakiella sp. A23]|nr:precorrin-8X methylmutase [Terasakiella sp. A23]MDV7339994.1 precorrin-8X methylmutase [Terasakiella sp. A23]
MTYLFDSYLMIDWSAASAPKKGADSIWYALVERTGGKLVETNLKNPTTREEAMKDVADLLSDLSARGQKVLVGCDFAFGYPRDFGQALNLKWDGVWRELSARITDGANNHNNRFEVAAEFNKRLSGTAGPFWGCPKAKQTEFLESKKPYLNPLTNEMRLCEQRISGVKPVWQLLGTGCVGSQTMMGIAHLEALRRHPWIADQVKVWPFETGLSADILGEITLAEIYPSQIKVSALGDLPKDAIQVRTMAKHYAELDQLGELGDLFLGDQDLSEDERTIAVDYEGWVLGVGKSDKDQALDWLNTYLKRPNDIYKKSQEMIEHDIDVSGFDEEMQDVAIRMIHACGDVDVGVDIAYSPGAANIGRAALADGCPILVDVEMVSHGIIRKRLSHNNPVICTLNDARTPAKAEELGTTRSAAAVEFWGEWLEGSVVVIGNAPTALFHLIQGILDGRFKKPALIVACPVGFVGAMESKETLIALADDLGVPYITLRGRRGGSAIAASSLNALAKKGITQ